MDNILSRFQKIVRKAHQFTDVPATSHQAKHPFEDRNIHQCIATLVQKLFDDGHYPQATFEAFKFVDRFISDLSNSSKYGFNLMMDALSNSFPKIHLTSNSTTSEKDEQKGYQFMFAGSILAIKNPRSHEHSIRESIDQCLDHLSLASLLLRRLETAGYKIPNS